MKAALVQFNPVVGDLEGNAARVVTLADEAARRGAELIVFPELCLVGYPPMDLLERRAFVDASLAAVDWAAERFPRDVGVLLGAPIPNESGAGKPLRNAALLFENGERVATVLKQKLPTYDVFDESRYFEPGTECAPIDWRGLCLGVHVCEDMWAADPVDQLGAAGTDVFVNVSASPFAVGKVAERDEIMRRFSTRYRRPFLYANQVGANTEILFDGSSAVCDATGRLVAAADPFIETIIYWEPGQPETARKQRDDIDDMLDALVMGIRDYVEKTAIFDRVVVGLSGGIDSAVTCALAVFALGPDRVLGITMPSRYSSPGSITDSEELAHSLGIELDEIPIRPAVDAFADMLAHRFEGTEPNVAEENIQARVRGVTLMAICNKSGHLLLTTGNKSELATGYATLYGDMSGGLAVISDVFKTDVYRVADRINRRVGRPLIPVSTIEKPPSAELRPDQQDTDSLPPYEILDPILQLYVEEGLDPEAIEDQTGASVELVEEIVRLVDRNEYKRQQAAPGLRVSRKAFGVGRRMPIVMNYRPIRSASSQLS